MEQVGHTVERKKQLRPGVPQEAVTGQIYASSEVEGLGRGRIVWLRSHEDNTILQAYSVLYIMLYSMVYNMLYIYRVAPADFCLESDGRPNQTGNNELRVYHCSAHIPIAA